MDKANRKELVSQYRARRLTGGIYRIVNSETGTAWTNWARDLQAVRNKFDFMVQMNSCTINALKSEWEQFGPQAFTFEILESITQQEEETEADFTNEIEELYAIWQNKT